MAVLPAKVALRPEVAGLGISVATVFSAESREELDAANRALKKAFYDYDASLTSYNEVLRNLEGVIPELSGEELQDLLEELRKDEKIAFEMNNLLSKLSAKSEFRKLTTCTVNGFRNDELDVLIEKWRTVHIPLVRRVRLSAIMLVFRRAQERGVEGAELDSEFPERFMAASQEEADSWQETAHLLAVPDDAERLLHSIRTVSQDRTDEILGFND